MFLLLLLLSTSFTPSLILSSTVVWTSSPTASPTRHSYRGQDSCAVASSNIDILDSPQEAFDAYTTGQLARVCEEDGFAAAGFDTQRRDPHGFKSIACFRQNTLLFKDHIWVGIPTRLAVHNYARLLKGCTGFLTGFSVPLTGRVERYSYEVAIVPDTPNCKIISTTDITLNNLASVKGDGNDIHNIDLGAHFLALSYGYQSGFTINDNPNERWVVAFGNCQSDAPTSKGVTLSPTTDGLGPASDCSTTCSKYHTYRYCQGNRPFCPCRWIPTRPTRRTKVGLCVPLNP
jgi:hypothetical protein